MTAQAMERIRIDGEDRGLKSLPLDGCDKFTSSRGWLVNESTLAEKVQKSPRMREAIAANPGLKDASLAQLVALGIIEPDPDDPMDAVRYALGFRRWRSTANAAATSAAGRSGTAGSGCWSTSA